MGFADGGEDDRESFASLVYTGKREGGAPMPQVRSAFVYSIHVAKSPSTKFRRDRLARQAHQEKEIPFAITYIHIYIYIHNQPMRMPVLLLQYSWCTACHCCTETPFFFVMNETKQSIKWGESPRPDERVLNSRE